MYIYIHIYNKYIICFIHTIQLIPYFRPQMPWSPSSRHREERGVAATPECSRAVESRASLRSSASNTTHNAQCALVIPGSVAVYPLPSSPQGPQTQSRACIEQQQSPARHTVSGLYLQGSRVPREEALPVGAEGLAKFRLGEPQAEGLVCDDLTRGASHRGRRPSGALQLPPWPKCPAPPNAPPKAMSSAHRWAYHGYVPGNPGAKGQRPAS